MAILILTHVCSTKGEPWHTHFSRYIFTPMLPSPSGWTVEENVWFNLFFYIKTHFSHGRYPICWEHLLFSFRFHTCNFFLCALIFFSHSYRSTAWCCFNQLWFIFIHHLFLRWLRSQQSASMRLGLSIHRSEGIFHHHLSCTLRSHLSETSRNLDTGLCKTALLLGGVEFSSPQHKIASHGEPGRVAWKIFVFLFNFGLVDNHFSDWRVLFCFTVHRINVW